MLSTSYPNTVDKNDCSPWKQVAERNRCPSFQKASFQNITAEKCGALGDLWGSQPLLLWEDPAGVVGGLTPLTCSPGRLHNPESGAGFSLTLRGGWHQSQCCRSRTGPPQPP